MTGKEYHFIFESFSSVKNLKKIIKKDNSFLSKRNIDRKTLYLHLASREDEGVVEFLKFLDEIYPKLRDAKARSGNDAYLAAAAGGNIHVMKYLEKEFQWNVKFVNKNGNDAFMLAAYYGHLNIMKYLVDVHYWDVSVKNKFGRNALFYAQQDKKQAVIDFLLNHDDVIGKVRLNITEFFSKQDKKTDELEKKIDDLQKQLKTIKELVQ